MVRSRSSTPKATSALLELTADQGQDKEPPKPGRMTFDHDGNLYVVERANCQIFVFDKDRKFKFKFGGIGDKRGEFKLLQDVAVDRQGRIYATDSRWSADPGIRQKGRLTSTASANATKGRRACPFPLECLLTATTRCGWSTRPSIA